MLILSRKKEESIIINGDIELKIISLDENRVRIGIQAPADVKIFRKELYEQITDENKAAMSSGKLVEEMVSLLELNKKNP